MGNANPEDRNARPSAFAMTFHDLLEEAGGIDFASRQTELFDELVHKLISRLPDSYSLKQSYKALLD